MVDGALVTLEVPRVVISLIGAGVVTNHQARSVGNFAESLSDFASDILEVSLRHHRDSGGSKNCKDGEPAG